MALLGGHASGPAAAAAFGLAARPWLEALAGGGVEVNRTTRLRLRGGELLLEPSGPCPGEHPSVSGLPLQETAPAGVGAPGAWRSLTVAASASALPGCTDLLLVSLAQEGSLAGEDMPVACLCIEDASVACFAAVAAVVGSVRFAAAGAVATSSGRAPTVQQALSETGSSPRARASVAEGRPWLQIAGRAILGAVLQLAAAAAASSPSLAAFLRGFVSEHLRFGGEGGGRRPEGHAPRLAQGVPAPPRERPLRWTRAHKGAPSAHARDSHALCSAARLLFDATGVDCKVVCGLSAR